MIKSKKTVQVLFLFTLYSGVIGQTVAKNKHSGNSQKGVIFQGYVVHGINNFNGKHIVDYSNVSPSIPYLNTSPPINEIGVYQESFNYSGTIIPDTDRDLPVATTRSFFDFFNPNGDIDINTVNIPLGEVGSSFLGPGFTGLDKRLTPIPFSESDPVPSVYRKKGFTINPTVSDWEKISGKLTVRKRKKRGYTVKLTIRNAFPNAIYTLWDIGTLNPLTVEETGYAVPLGGLPNVLVTDKFGCGYVKLKLKYDLSRPCVAGTDSCSSYISAFFNWDNGVYGASAAATWAKAPTGVFGGNQMAWPTTGIKLIEPQNNFRPKSHGCKHLKRHLSGIASNTLEVDN